MNQAIDYMLKQIHIQIPMELLNLAFPTQSTHIAVDSQIKEKIIVGLVLPACNLYSGKIAKILLKDSYSVAVDSNNYPFPLTDGRYSIYKIPPHEREYKDITYVLDITYPLGLFSSYGYSPEIGSNTIMGLASEALSAATSTPQYLTPIPILLSGNMIRLDPPQAFHVDWIVSCMLNYDENFNNVYPNVYRPLGKMTVFATQAFIYNELYIKINQGYLIGGKNLEAIKNIVEDYKDAYEKFQEEIKNFRGEAAFDKDQLVDLISLML